MGLVKTINGMQAVDAVYNDVKTALTGYIWWLSIDRIQKNKDLKDVTNSFAKEIDSWKVKKSVKMQAS